MPLVSAVNRVRFQRMVWTFREVHTATGSLPRTMAHMLRFISRKLVPLLRYASFTVFRLFVLRGLRRRNSAVLGRPVVGIRVLGGVGDCIVIARYLRDLQAGTEPILFDLYSNKPAVSRWIFSGVPGFRFSHGEAIFSPAKAGYTLAMQVSQFVVVEDAWISPDLATGYPGLARAVDSIRRMRPSLEPIIAEHPRLDSFLAQKAVFANRSRRDWLQFMSAVPYGGDAIAVSWSDDARRRHGLMARPYVTVHNGYDPDMVVSNARATKCYPHFGQVIAMLRATHPDVAFVQLGIHTSQPLPAADIDLIGRTSLAEAAGLIRGALFHIDNESGLVHLAAAMGTRSCVVFGPTSSRYFGYPANISVDPGFCGGCWWITETWMNHCPRGFATARCMTEQPPSLVAQAARALFPAETSPLAPQTMSYDPPDSVIPHMGPLNYKKPTRRVDS